MLSRKDFLPFGIPTYPLAGRMAVVPKAGKCLGLSSEDPELPEPVPLGGVEPAPLGGFRSCGRGMCLGFVEAGKQSFLMERQSVWRREAE